MGFKAVQPSNLGGDFTIDTANQKIINDCILAGVASPTANPPELLKKWLFFNTATKQITHYWSGTAWVSTHDNTPNLVVARDCPTAATTYLQSRIDETPDGGKLLIPNCTINMGVVNITKSIEIEGQPSTKINLTGVGAGFRLNASVNYLSFKQLSVLGDGTVPTNPTDNQIGIGAWTSASVAQKFRVEDVTIDSCVQGIDTTGFQWVHAEDVNILRSKGISAGQGYGIVCGNAKKVTLINVTAQECQRHGIYLGATENASLVGCNIIDHRKGLALGGSYSPGMMLSRVGFITVVGCHFDGGDDSPLGIDDDTQMAGSLSDVTVSNCVFRNQYRAIVIGSPGAGSADNMVRCVNFTGNTYRANALGQIGMVIYNAQSLNIQANTFDYKDSTVANTSTIIDLGVLPGSGQTSDVWKIANNQFRGRTGVGSIYAVEVRSSICTGTQRVDMYENQCVDMSKYLLDATVTNSNLRAI